MSFDSDMDFVANGWRKKLEEANTKIADLERQLADAIAECGTLKYLKERNNKLRLRINAMESLLGLTMENKTLRAKNERLRDTIIALEERLAEVGK